MVSLKEYQPDRIALEVYEACARRAAAEPRRGYLGMSQIGGLCERALWFQAHGADRDPFDGQTCRRWDCGHATEARVIADLRAAGYTITGEQDGFEDFGGRFKGHRDGVIHGISKSHPERLLEIKSANDAAFKTFQRHGLKSKPVYEAQMQCYMGYGHHERGLFMVENKNSQGLYTERVCFDLTTFEALKVKAKRILDAPEPPAKIADESECRFCGYTVACACPPQVQALDPPAPPAPALVGCYACQWFRPMEKSAEETRREVVITLRTIIQVARNMDQAQQSRSRKQLFALMNEGLGYRPDLRLPMDVLCSFDTDLPKKFAAILEHILTPGHGWMTYSGHLLGLGDILTCDFTSQPAEGHWCACPDHKARVLTPEGRHCPDEMPF